MITVGSYFDVVYIADSDLDVVCSNIINSTIIVPPDFFTATLLVVSFPSSGIPSIRRVSSDEWQWQSPEKD